VVIAAFEASAFIAQAIDSVLVQTQPAYEIVVCDDGSTDDLERALEPYHDRITFVRQEHRGENAAKNACFRAATGDFVVILDADDVFLPERLSALAELAMQRPDLDILTTDAYLEVDGHIRGRYYRGTARFVEDDQRRGVIRTDFIFGLAAVRREPLLAIGGWDESLQVGGDADCWARLILGGSKAGLVDEPLAVYRLRAGSASSDRVANLLGAVGYVERCLAHPSLTDEERRFGRGVLEIKRREAALLAAEAALRGLRPNPRRRCLEIAFGLPGYGVSVRTKAAAAAIAPRAAGHYLAWRERRTGRSPLRLSTHGR
jgi:hypothetical protein